MKASDVMTRRVISVGPDASIESAVRLMLQDHMSGLPVVDQQGRLMGIVTEGDLLRRSEAGTARRRSRWVELLLGPGRAADEYVQTHGRKVEEVMTHHVVTIAEDTPLPAIVEMMERHRIKRLPVLRGQQLVGIVSRADLLHALAAVSRSAPPRSISDATIRDQVLQEIDKQSWGPGRTVNVTVHDGIVDLWGVILDERQREALRVAAENTAGVHRVEDHLVWVEPLSGLVVGPTEGT